MEGVSDMSDFNRVYVEAYNENHEQILGNLDGQGTLPKVNYKQTKKYSALATTKTLDNRVKYYLIVDYRGTILEKINNSAFTPKIHIPPNKSTAKIQNTKLILREAADFTDLARHIGTMHYVCELEYTITHTLKDTNRPRPASKLGQIRLAIRQLQEAERKILESMKKDKNRRGAY
jgi:hypothetical protein